MLGRLCAKPWALRKSLACRIGYGACMLAASLLARFGTGSLHLTCARNRQITAFPCRVAHDHLGNSASCEVNLLRRWIKAWQQSMGLYLPVSARLRVSAA